MNLPYPSLAAMTPGDPRRTDCLICDADDPVVAEFIRAELLRGTIRTVPTRRRGILVVPSDSWSAARPQIHS